MNCPAPSGGAQAHPLAALGLQQFIVALLVWNPTKNKHDKLPADWRTGTPCNAHDPQFHTTYAHAVGVAQALGSPYTVGLVLTAADDLFCLDIDGARQADGTWSPLAQQLCAALPGCLVEVSQSGRGLHLWGCYANPPPHTKRRIDLNIELYTEARFIAIGTPLAGAIAPRCDALPALIDAWFAPQAVDAQAVPTSGPCEGYTATLTDDELLQRAMASRSTASRFGAGGATFADLWHADAEVLGRAYRADPGSAEPFDRSSADAALASHLAWWTGKDAERIDRLMRRSALVREKYERPDYLPRTITGACARVSGFYGAQQGQAATVPAPPVATPAAAAAPDPSQRHTHILSVTPLATARVFIAEEFPGDSLRYWQGAYYRWRAGAWTETGKDDPHAWVYRFLERRPERNDLVPNRENVAKILDALKAAAHLDSTTAPPAWLDAEGGPPPAELVPCINGLLHVPTGRMLPPTPRLFNLNALPVAYDPAAPVPARWLAFLAQVWPGDVEAVQALQEVFGYLLTPDTSQQKLFLIVGPRRSGKGTIARVLTALLGAGNVASPTLSSMSDSFGLQPLVGKLAAVISDARLSGRTDQQTVAENLLRISGEDQVEVNRKFLPPLALRLGVRFVLLTNELPKIADASGAMASRFIILRMTESFLGREDHGLTARLLDELPGVLNWALQGWHRLRERGHFRPPASSAEITQEMADLGSPIGAFIRDCCEITPGAVVPVDEIYRAWLAWCMQQGIGRPSSKQWFCRDLGSAVPALKRTHPTIGGDRVTCYSGIRLQGCKGMQGHFSIAALSGVHTPTHTPRIT